MALVWKEDGPHKWRASLGDGRVARIDGNQDDDAFICRLTGTVDGGTVGHADTLDEAKALFDSGRRGAAQHEAMPAPADLAPSSPVGVHSDQPGEIVHVADGDKRTVGVDGQPEATRIDEPVKKPDYRGGGILGEREPDPPQMPLGSFAERPVIEPPGAKPVEEPQASTHHLVNPEAQPPAQPKAAGEKAST